MPSSDEHRIKFEVLVFDEPGICPVSRNDLVDSFNTVLAFKYWVGTIDHEGLHAENWTNSCALLVFPHCTNTQPYDELDVDLPTISRIHQFVAGGGSFLGVCGGAYFASRTAEWDGRLWGSSNLAFWPWFSKGPHLGEGVQTHEITLPFLIGQHPTNEQNANNTTPYCDLHCDGGGEFVCESDNANSPFTLMGCYSPNRYAGVKCPVDAGRAVLWHARVERSFRNGEVARGFQRTYGSRKYDFEKLERHRFRVLRHTLRHLNLQPAPEAIHQLPLSPLPQFLVTTPSQPQPRPQTPFAHLPAGVVSGECEDFELKPLSWAIKSDWAVVRRKAAHHCERATRPRRIWVVCSEELPQQWSHTPHFNLANYFKLLGNARGRQLSNTLLGNNLLYGEAVTSTQTQLELNPNIASLLPCPLLSLATYQLQGVSRNGKPWLSPYGVLQWSLLLELPPGLEHLTQNLDLFMHLLGLTVVETCRLCLPDTTAVLALKWPNDIYASVDGRLEKIGGIFVNNIPGTPSGSRNRILIGCGLNVCNNGPLYSLSRLTATELSMEEVLANIMARFSLYWDEFLLAGGSFAGFEERYQSVWLHSGWRGQIRRNPHSETMACTMLRLDASGRLRIQVANERDVSMPTQDVSISADRFSLDIHRSLIYPRVH